jgi:predicted AlkP superfamily phosphohydrolase/phosphomutase
MRRRVLVIGLDGGSFNLLMPWMREGHLPNLMRFVKEGCYGNLRSTIPFGTFPAWPSFYTGMNPGKHGILSFYMKSDNGYSLTPAINEYAVGAPIWDVLSENGKTSCFINVPATYPPKKLKGCMVTGLVTPREENYTYPPELENELKRMGYRVNFKEIYVRGEDSLLADLHETSEIRTEAALYLMDKYDWDFFMLVYSGTDRIQHEFYKYLDRNHPRNDKSKTAKYQREVLNYFKKIDQQIGRLLERIDDNTTTIIMSDHGFRPLYYHLATNLFLQEIGMLKFKNDFASRLKILLYKLGFNPKNIHRLLAKLRLGRIHTKVRIKSRYKLMDILFLSMNNVDFSASKAYSIGVSGNEIYINLKGRETQGCVDESEYEKVRDEITSKLLEWRDPNNGRKVIKAVYKREEIYSGDLLAKAPDIFYIPNEYYDGFNQQGFVSFSSINPALGLSGTHAIKGIFMAMGGEIKAGGKIDEVDILDLMPTIFHILDVPTPYSVDGRILREIFAENSPLNKKIAKMFNIAPPLKEKREFHWTKEDEEAIKERLRELGYIS